MAGFKSIEEAIEFARGVATEQGWGFGLYSQSSDRAAFEVWDHKTGHIQSFEVRPARDQGIHIVQKQRQPVGRLVASLFAAVFIILMAWAAVDSGGGRDCDHPDYDPYCDLGNSVGPLVAVIAIVRGGLAILGLAWMWRSERSQADRSFDETARRMLSL
jgi:hypothetical protein